MTNQGQETKKRGEPNTLAIPHQIQDAFYLGAGSGLLSLIFDVPGETAWKIGVAGAGFSLLLSGTRSIQLGKPRRVRGRQIPYNSGKQSGKIRMEYAIGQLADKNYTSSTNQSFLSRIIWGKSKNSVGSNAVVTIPEQEFVFHSHYDGYPFQLRDIHVKLFLKSAWRNRQYGKGLSARRWVREFSQRPAWWKELSPTWYYAMMNLLYDAERMLGVQLVYSTGNSWHMLANEPLWTYGKLKEYVMLGQL